MIKIYTDGSSRGNPGLGGYGIAVFTSDNNLQLAFSKQYDDEVTNNQMELEAILYALKLTQDRYKEEECIIYCDSSYCVNICNEWIFTWAKQGWIRGKNQEIKNLDLIKKIYKYVKLDFPNFVIQKCHGHAGDFGNEIADALAAHNSKKFVEILRKNNISYPNILSVDF